MTLIMHTLSIAVLPNDIHVDWFHEKMEREDKDDGMHMTTKEWEYAC